jgi:hypothetical protein
LLGPVVLAARQVEVLTETQGFQVHWVSTYLLAGAPVVADQQQAKAVRLAVVVELLSLVDRLFLLSREMMARRGRVPQSVVAVVAVAEPRAARQAGSGRVRVSTIQQQRTALVATLARTLTEQPTLETAAKDRKQAD